MSDRRQYVLGAYWVVLTLFALALTGCAPKEEPQGVNGGTYYTGPVQKPGTKEPK